MLYSINVRKNKNIWLPFTLLIITCKIGFAQEIPDDSTVSSDSIQKSLDKPANKKGVYDLRNLKIPLRANLTNRSNSISSYGGNFGFQAKDEDAYQGVPLNKLEISGIFRFVTIYRNMEESYADMQTSKKNISFLDYPLADIATSGGIGNPILSLALTSKVNKNASFRISYSISHSFTGSSDNKTNKFFASNGGLAFESSFRTKPVLLGLKFGGLLTMRTSRLIFDTPKFRGNSFDRLVSNQYSVSKFEGMYTKEDSRVYNWPYVRGGIATFTFPGLKDLYIKTMFGRTGQTIAGINTVDLYPAYSFMGRTGIPYNFGRLRGNFALNYFARKTETDSVSGIKDNVDVYSTDFDVKIGKYFILSTELGTSLINNPLILNQEWGGAFIANLKVDKSFLKFIPLTLEFYEIGYNYGNLDGEVMNSNVNLRGGGVNGDPSTNQNLFVNVGQEVGQVANNRRGISLFTELTVGKFSAELGYAASMERENLHDSITLQHRVNAFSRSRFWQWRQNIGPYSRIRSVFARTYELITITDSASNYKKGFNNIELNAKYNFSLGKLKFALINYTTYTSIQDRAAISPVFNDKAFIRTFFEDFTLMCKLTNRLMVLGNFGLERVYGNTRVNLSPDKPTAPDEERVINQTGTAIGAGFGYDITNKASIHFRHKWMDHKDKNFTLDVFKGQESTIELKIFL